jgi:hypothetical protein
MRIFFLMLSLLVWARIAQPAISDEPANDDFDHQIAPLIAQRCLNCHSGDEPKGKLDLSSRARAMAGGESGVAIDPGKLATSLLWEYIDSDQMPPKKPLSVAEKAQLKAWIEGGANGARTISIRSAIQPILAPELTGGHCSQFAMCNLPRRFGPAGLQIPLMRL